MFPETLELRVRGFPVSGWGVEWGGVNRRQGDGDVRLAEELDLDKWPLYRRVCGYAPLNELCVSALSQNELIQGSKESSCISQHIIRYNVRSFVIVFQKLKIRDISGTSEVCFELELSYDRALAASTFPGINQRNLVDNRSMAGI